MSGRKGAASIFGTSFSRLPTVNEEERKSGSKGSKGSNSNKMKVDVQDKKIGKKKKSQSLSLASLGRALRTPRKAAQSADKKIKAEAEYQKRVYEINKKEAAESHRVMGQRQKNKQDTNDLADLLGNWGMNDPMNEDKNAKSSGGRRSAKGKKPKSK